MCANVSTVLYLARIALVLLLSTSTPQARRYRFPAPSTPFLTFIDIL